MILDTLENAHRYTALNSGFAKAFEFLQRPDLKTLPVDKYEIDGERVYATVVKDFGRKKGDARLETHREYIDIQLVLAGTDTMGWKPLQACTTPAGAYDQDVDLQFYLDPPDAWLATGSGNFAIFFPEDAHMPMVSPEQLHKIVVKVAVEQN